MPAGVNPIAVNKYIYIYIFGAESFVFQFSVQKYKD